MQTITISKKRQLIATESTYQNIDVNICCYYYYKRKNGFYKYKRRMDMDTQRSSGTFIQLKAIPMYIVCMFMCGAHIETYCIKQDRVSMCKRKHIHERIEHRLQPSIIVYLCCSKPYKRRKMKKNRKEDRMSF